MSDPKEDINEQIIRLREKWHDLPLFFLSFLNDCLAIKSIKLLNQLIKSERDGMLFQVLSSQS